jgi:hyaluronan synthase
MAVTTVITTDTITSNMTTRTATTRKRYASASGSLVLVALALWAIHHFLQMNQHIGKNLGIVWITIFIILVLQTVFYQLERPVKASDEELEELDKLKVSAIVPVYNEDPGYLKVCLSSFLAQERPLHSVHIVDDGSTTGDYAEVKRWWRRAAKRKGIYTTWRRTPNQGKRHAQIAGALLAPEPDIILTVDSDSELAPNALYELLKPFKDPKVQSVAGIVLARNNSVNFLARITDLLFVTSQFVDRSGLSFLKSVMVNSGPIAAYRCCVVYDNIDTYLSETFAGRKVTFSDDSLLTLFALLRGKTVQQPTAFCFSAMPEKMSHHTRQYLRWMRGSTIRSMWRFKYLPLDGVAYWAHLLRWVQVFLSTGAVLYLLTTSQVGLYTLLIPFSIGASQSLRYLTVKRSDQCICSQFATWLLAPLSVLWSWFILRPLRWYGMATCWKTGWGTRKTIELTTEG